MTTDEELATETTSRQSADTALQSQIDNHVSRHLPSGADALSTDVAVDTGTANSAGTADSFSRSDHVHKTVIQYYDSRSVAPISTTSTADVSMLTITAPIAGTYIAIVNSTFTHSNNNGEATISAYVGGTQQTNTEETMVRSSNVQLTYSISLPVVVNGSEDVAIYWRTNTGTLTNILRSLTLIKVA